MGPDPDAAGQLATLKDAGKEVVVYLKSGGGNRELWLATVGSRVLMAPQGTLGPLGLVSEASYIRPVLDKLGLRVEVEARHEFKTAAERAVRDGMSEAQREQTLALMQRIDAALREGLEARGVDVDALLEAALVGGPAAVEAKVVDALVYDDALALEITGDANPRTLRDAGSWLAWHSGRIFAPLSRPKYVAVVPVHGTITMQAPRRPANRPSADHETLMQAIRVASRDRRAVAVVLHVDSPGGSALASDLVHREVIACRRKKPVVACFADVAASGGYYIGVGAAAIWAQPLTITGSIGVIMARLVAVPLLERLGVVTERVRLAPHADLLSPSKEPEDAERAILAREADAFYEGFVTVVAEGRDRPYDEVEPLARGRVWAGADAHDRGLVDQLGSLRAAVTDAAKRAGLSEKRAIRIEAAVVRVKGGTPPPAHPPEEAAEALLTTLGLSTTHLDAARLATTGERVLYLATGLPTPK